MPPDSFSPVLFYWLKHYTLDVMCNPLHPFSVYLVAYSTQPLQCGGCCMLLQFNIDRRRRWYLIVIYIIERDKLRWLPLESREFIVQDLVIRVILCHSLS